MSGGALRSWATHGYQPPDSPSHRPPGRVLVAPTNVSQTTGRAVVPSSCRAGQRPRAGCPRGIGRPVGPIPGASHNKRGGLRLILHAQRRSAPPDDLLPSERNVPMRMATYTRISTDEDHQPYSLEAQAERLGNYVASQDGWELVRKFTDQASGATTERPGLQRALSEAKAHRFDMLLVYRVDRYAGSVRAGPTTGRADPAGVGFRSATEPFDTPRRRANDGPDARGLRRVRARHDGRPR